MVLSKSFLFEKISPSKKRKCRFYSKKFKLSNNNIINFDKPRGMTMYDLVKKIKTMTNYENINAFDFSDSYISGCTLVHLGYPKFLKKIIRILSSDFIGVIKIPSLLEIDSKRFKSSFDDMKGNVFYTKYTRLKIKKIKTKNIFSCKLLSFKKKKKACLIGFSSESCIERDPLNYLFSKIINDKSVIKEIRRISIGPIGENHMLTNFHELSNLNWFFGGCKNEKFFKNSFFPINNLFSRFKKIFVKNSTINSICYGAKIYSDGVYLAEKGIEIGEYVILVSVNNESVAIGISNISSVICIDSHESPVVSIFTVIMERDLYPKKWKFGLKSVKKSILFSTFF